jgi:hypothetical protein
VLVMETTMVTLLIKFKSNPTIENAIKVRKYAAKHPFSTLVLNDELIEIFGQAIDLTIVK